MHRFRFLSLLLTIAALFTFSGCETGGGYNNSAQPWMYGTIPQQPAEQPPNTLSDAAPRPEMQGPLQPVTSSEAQPALPGEMGAEMPPVKVALLLPLSGKNEALGQAMLQAAQIALFDVGRNSFELLPRDTKGTPDGARAAAKSAIADGAGLILGPVFTDEVRAVKSETHDINIIAFSTDWTLAGDNTFIMGFMPFDQIERITEFSARHNLHRIGVIAPKTDYGNVVTAAYQSMATRFGLNTVDVLTFSGGNMEDSIKKFARYHKDAQSEPPFDAVLMATGGDTAVSISNLMNTYGLPPSSVKRLGTGLFDDMALAAEPSLNGSWFAAPSPRLRDSFERRFQETYSYPAPRISTLAYDATALASVLAQKGITAQGIPAFDRASITNPNGFAGIDGIFRFRSDGTAERGLAVLQIRQGRISIVDDAPRTFQDMQF